MIENKMIILERARSLINDAYKLGIVITIDNIPQQPLAMGNYAMIPSVRQARTMSGKEEIKYAYNNDSLIVSEFDYDLYPDHKFFRGSQAAYIELAKNSRKKSNEYIFCSACIDFKTDEIFAVNKQGRHHHVVHYMSSVGIPQTTLGNQGFLTDRGKYVDRDEAMMIALKAKQMLNKDKIHGLELFSEDVW